MGAERGTHRTGTPMVRVQGGRAPSVCVCKREAAPQGCAGCVCVCVCVCKSDVLCSPVSVSALWGGDDTTSPEPPSGVRAKPPSHRAWGSRDPQRTQRVSLFGEKGWIWGRRSPPRRGCGAAASPSVWRSPPVSRWHLRPHPDIWVASEPGSSPRPRPAGPQRCQRSPSGRVRAPAAPGGGRWWWWGWGGGGGRGAGGTQRPPVPPLPPRGSATLRAG